MNTGRVTPFLAIVIPTSNRADLAINACESLLPQTGCAFHVTVSDNSTDAGQVRRLADYCAGADRSRLTYIRPAEPLPMAAHWDWALHQAMTRTAGTHFCIHYDRKVTKPRSLQYLSEIVAEFPHDLITTMVDSVVNLDGTSRPGNIAWTGRVYTIPTAYVVSMTAEGKVTELGQVLPMLSNCTVPRAVLERITERFASICDSTTPDSCFAYRFCATHQQYVHFDRALGILHGYHRSIGVGYLRGEGGDFRQYMQVRGDRPWLEAAPIPGLTLGQNILFHEYELVRRATGDPRFKAVEMAGYLREVSRDLKWIADPVRWAEVVDILKRHGWTPECLARLDDRPRALRVRDGWPWLKTLMRDLWDESAPRILPKLGLESPHTGIRAALATTARRTATVLRRGRAALERWAADVLRIPPRHLSDFEFATDQEAIRYALTWPRPRDERSGLSWFAGVARDVTPDALRRREDE